ncbi:hypothetical protein ABE021_13515 [Sporosarcina gallistercoris]|uniref:hypothetical protein n=1 Tax=Sporosarcina gallistercoris TaxID=2762245 RepID=UPI003D2CFD7F
MNIDTSAPTEVVVEDDSIIREFSSVRACKLTEEISNENEKQLRARIILSLTGAIE